MGCVLYVLYGEEDCGMDWVIRTRGGTRLLSHISSRHTGHPHGAAPPALVWRSRFLCLPHTERQRGGNVMAEQVDVHTYMYGISRYDYRAGRKQGAGL